ASLPDGRVLITGGSNGSVPVATSEVFDPTTNTVSAGPAMSSPRMGHSATTLLDGRVLLAGGNDGSADLASAEIFDASAGSFSPASSGLVTARQGHLAFLLPLNNSVLILGGSSSGVPVANTELFTPWLGSFSATGPLTTGRSSASGSAMQLEGL